MDGIAMSQTVTETAGFEAWCDRVRQLLGWSEGVGDEWPALFAAGSSPRDAARATVYGDSEGD
jgi:hypothetical protein